MFIRKVYSSPIKSASNWWSKHYQSQPEKGLWSEHHSSSIGETGFMEFLHVGKIPEITIDFIPSEAIWGREGTEGYQ